MPTAQSSIFAQSDFPQVGSRTNDGKYAENTELFPDIEVYNTPEDYIEGRDRQLEAAVKELLGNK